VQHSETGHQHWPFFLATHGLPTLVRCLSM